MSSVDVLMSTSDREPITIGHARFAVHDDNDKRDADSRFSEFDEHSSSSGHDICDSRSGRCHWRKFVIAHAEM